MRYLYGLIAGLLTAVLLTLPSECLAHSINEGYLIVKMENSRIQGTLDLLETNLNQTLHSDPATAPFESPSFQKKLKAEVLKNLNFKIDNQILPFRITEIKPIEQSVGRFIQFRIESAAFSKKPESIEIFYGFFFPVRPEHRGILNLTDGTKQLTAVFNSRHQRERIPLTLNQELREFLQFIHLGIEHILSGFDHLLFLISLLLTSVVVRRRKSWQIVSSFKEAFVQVIKLATVFTIAHSITLSLATLNLVVLPSKLVESAISLSIMAVAANNLFVFFDRMELLIIFFFGLFHGLGFATVLKDLNLSSGLLRFALFGFNFGVEFGQIAVIAIVLPALYLLSRKEFYTRTFLRPVSIGIILIAALWLFEILFGISLLPKGT